MESRVEKPHIHTRKSIALRSLMAALGLIVYTFGDYLTIQANIGYAPWTCFNVGVSSQLGISIGTASMTLSAVIVIVDILIHERIGIGTVLDAVICGVFLDVFTATGVVPVQSDNPVMSGVLMLAGLFVMAFAQVVYMSAALGCGPRDSLLVGLGKRARKLPIGLIAAAMLVTVTAVGYLLGGKVGIGTIIAAFGAGITMQVVFRLARFEPRNVSHEDITASLRTLFGRGTRNT